jgi:hypothetical protein
LHQLTAKPGRPHGHFMRRIAVQVEMPDFMSDHHNFIGGVLALENVDYAVGALKQTIDPWPEALTGQKMADFEIILLECFGDQCGCAAITLGIGQGPRVALPRLAAYVDPRIHYHCSSSQ